MKEDIPKHMLKIIEKNIKWSIGKFFEFYFPVFSAKSREDTIFSIFVVMRVWLEERS